MSSFMMTRRSRLSEDSLRTIQMEEDADKESAAFLGVAASPPRKTAPRFDYKRLLLGTTAFVVSLIALSAAYSLGQRSSNTGGLGPAQNETTWSELGLQTALQEALESLRMPHDTPDWRSMPMPETILPNTSEATLKQPLIRTFPTEYYAKLYNDPKPDVEPEPLHDPMPEDAYERDWKSPDWFDPDRDSTGSDLPRVQAEKSAFKESSSEKVIRLGRRDAVKRAFIHAWQGYKSHAWGHDEVRPVSKSASDPFAGWGATIIDSLETLLVMGLQDEYNECREHVNRLDFRLVEGKDWAYGYRPLPAILANESAPEYLRLPHKAGRATDIKLRVFETHIRYLGGLLGAYDLSGDKLMLERAEELAEILSQAYKTQTSIPLGYLNPGHDHTWYRSESSLAAEMGSNILEFTRLSQVTGNRSYFDIGQRTTDWLQEHVVNNTLHPPLLPVSLNSDMKDPNSMSATYTIGGMVDSYYEYMIKQHLLVGGASDQYAKIYKAAIQTARKGLFQPISSYEGRDYLTCFAGGMLGLGGKLLNDQTDLDDGKRLTQTCYMMGAMTESGLQPEIINFQDPQNPSSYEHVEVELPGETEYGGSRWLVQDRLKGSPAGSIAIMPQYQGRPETIESVFYMYRLTGDKAWQDRGWRMFTSWVAKCKADAGFSEVSDTRHENPPLSDKMESFVLAETLKYYYLLFSEPDLLSLDEYVFNTGESRLSVFATDSRPNIIPTEAHPFLLHNKSPGSGKFWTKKKDQDLGVRASGTDTQLWMRYELMSRES